MRAVRIPQLQYLYNLLQFLLSQRSPQAMAGGEQMRLPARSRLAFDIASIRRCGGDNERFRWLASFVEKDLLRANQDGLKQSPMKLPEYDFASHQPESFKEKFYDASHPVVIKGANSPAFGSLDVDKIMEILGNQPVQLTCTASSLAEEHRLSDLGSPTPYGGNWYCENLTVSLDDAFDDSAFGEEDADYKLVPSDIIKLLDTQQLAPLLGRDGTDAYKYDLFFGTRTGPTTPLHCNAEYNFFYQLQGRKKWILIDSRATEFLYPLYSRSGFYQLSCIGNPWANDADVYFPLLKYVPRYEIVLEPGDILFNVPGWWHAIELIDAPNLSVATRWLCEPDLTKAGGFLGFFWKNFGCDRTVSAHDNLIRNLVGMNLWTQRSDRDARNRDSDGAEARNAASPVLEQ